MGVGILHVLVYPASVCMYLSYMCGVKSPCTSIVCYLYILALNVFPGHLVPCVTYRDLVPCTFLRGRATTVNTQPYVSRNEKGASASTNTAIPYKVQEYLVLGTSYLAGVLQSPEYWYLVLQASVAGKYLVPATLMPQKVPLIMSDRLTRTSFSLFLVVSALFILP